MITHFGRRLRASTLGAALALMLAAGPALAQGTDEQREACAPDAVKLCQDTIPDIPKTTACMKRHFAELSPRCKVAFNAVTGGGAKPDTTKPEKPSRRTTRREETTPPPAPAPSPDQDAAAEAAPETVPGLRAYKAYIRQSCRDGLIDAFTCRNTLETLGADE